MAHEIEEFADGSAAFVSAREDAWHRLGTVLDSTFTAEQAMTFAKLGKWNVRKTPLTTTVTIGSGKNERTETVAIPDQYATVRTNPVKRSQIDVLGIVGDWYEPIQNEEHCELLNTLVDESGAHFETAGSLKGGREVFVTMKLPDTMQIGGRDAVDTYIAALNSHDGSSNFRLLVTPVRIVCANTQNAALRGAKYVHNIRHTSGARAAISEAREALGMTFKYMESFEKEAEKMINAELRTSDFVNKVRHLIPESTRRTSDKSHDNYEKKIIILRDLFTESATNADIRGTRWGGYQAVTEYLDHFSPVRGASDNTVAGMTRAAEARALKTLTKASTMDLKLRAFETFAVKGK